MELLAELGELPVISALCSGIARGGRLGRRARPRAVAPAGELDAALRLASSARLMHSAGSMPLSAGDGACEQAAPPYSDLR